MILKAQHEAIKRRDRYFEVVSQTRVRSVHQSPELSGTCLVDRRKDPRILSEHVTRAPVQRGRQGSQASYVVNLS